jgi:hypothetical protein
MGQQQILLIVVGVILVGIAVAISVNMFKDHFRSSSERHLVSALEYLAARAVTMYDTPSAQMGLGHDYSSLTIQTLLENTPVTDIGTFTLQHAAPDSLIILGTAASYPEQKLRITVTSVPGPVERQ